MRLAGYELQLAHDHGKPSRLRTIASPLAALIVAAAVGAIPLLIGGVSVWTAYDAIVHSAFGGRGQISDTLLAASPLILTAAAAAIPFSMRLWNIGAEGQLQVGAIAASGAALAFAGSLPSVLAIPLLLLAGAIGGALWALVAAVPRVLLGTNEILLTLMLNFVALYIVQYLILGSSSYWSDPTSLVYPRGREIPGSAFLPSLFGGPVDLGFCIAVAAAVVGWAILRLSRLGFSMRTISSSAKAAAYAGVSIKRTSLAVMAIAGLMAGLGGAIEVGNTSGGHNLDPANIVGFGFTGIVVAALARLNLLAAVPIAIIIGGLTNASFSLQVIHVPAATGQMLQGVILLCALGAEFLVRRSFVIRRVRSAQPAESEAT